MTSAQISALAKTAVFSVVVPGLVAWYVPRWILGGFPAVHWDGLSIASAALLVLGAAIYLRCAWEFSVTGLGTPAIMDAPKVLVVRGLHRYVRNPMYIGVMTAVAGEAALFGARPLVVYVAVLWTFFHTFVMFYEEPHLAHLFGAQYTEYCAQVHRWWPRWR
jgi:protein-S-isoprenylcysteine O-methyltransferase Ste14